jgi:hypothetical protein
MGTDNPACGECGGRRKVHGLVPCPACASPATGSAAAHVDGCGVSDGGPCTCANPGECPRCGRKPVEVRGDNAYAALCVLAAVDGIAKVLGIPHPKALDARAFIDNFDDGLPVNPFEFHLDFKSYT